MIKKYLGKIDNAQFGFVPDMPFLFGLQLAFTFDSCCRIGTGGKYVCNIGINKDNTEKVCKYVCDILKQANCHHVSELIGKPVEIELDEDKFSNFRILTEVL